MSGIAVFNKAVSTLQDSQRNLQAISIARQKLDQQKERLDFEKKKGEVQLEGMRLDNSAKKSDMEFAKKTMDSKIKLMKMALEQQGSMIDHEEENQQGILQESMETAKTVARTDPYVLVPYMTAGGDMGVRPIRTNAGGSKQSVRPKDVRTEARAMWKDAGEQGSVDDYMGNAEKVLSGQSIVKENKPTSAETKQFLNKKTGKLESFKRDGAGKWVKI